MDHERLPEASSSAMAQPWMAPPPRSDRDVSGRFALLLPSDLSPEGGWPLVVVVEASNPARSLEAEREFSETLNRWGCAVLQVDINPARSDMRKLMRAVHQVTLLEDAVDPNRLGVAQLRDDGVALQAFNGNLVSEAFVYVGMKAAPSEVAMWMTEHLW